MRVAVPAVATLACLGAAASIVTATTTAVPVDKATTTKASSGKPTASTLTMLDWNVHYGVGYGNPPQLSSFTDPQGSDQPAVTAFGMGPAIDLEHMARVVELSGANVVTLQEVNRGWVFGGGTDMAEWLSHRLGMRYVWAPAADRQFGNLILAYVPLEEPTVTELPYGAGPQERSAISATLSTKDGSVRVTSAHLQHRNENTATRLSQIEALMTKHTTLPHIVAGDFNARPSWPEVMAMHDEGFTSAQDDAGNPSALTFPANKPVERIDYLFGSEGVEFSDVRIGTSRASDHRPILAHVILDAQ